MNIYRTFTPEQVEELGPYDIFVFGSNLNGHHDGGAAKTAVDKFPSEKRKKDWRLKQARV